MVIHVDFIQDNGVICLLSSNTECVLVKQYDVKTLRDYLQSIGKFIG